MTGFAYSNNGLSFRMVEASWDLEGGEVYFAAMPSAGELGSAFPGYATASAAAALAGSAVVALQAGLTITLSGTITLAATIFPTDPATQIKLASVAATIGATGAFPGGVSALPMKDGTGAWHNFDLAQWKAVAGAIAGYAAELQLILDGNPLGATDLPSSSVSLTV